MNGLQMAIDMRHETRLGWWLLSSCDLFEPRLLVSGAPTYVLRLLFGALARPSSSLSIPSSAGAFGRAGPRLRCFMRLARNIALPAADRNRHLCIWPDLTCVTIVLAQLHAL